MLVSKKYSPIRRLGGLPIYARYARTEMFSSENYILSTITGDEDLRTALL